MPTHALRVPLMAPIGAVWNGPNFTSTSSSGYQVTISAEGTVLKFGGQNYGSVGAARTQMDNLLVVTPGPGTPVALNSTIKAATFSNPALVTWNRGPWTFQVTATSGTESLSQLEQTARQLAAAVQAQALPGTTLGILSWTHAGNGHDTLSISWQQGANAYYVNEQGTKVTPLLQMASDMRPYPTGH